ncbi:hypothetical protein TMES_19945 [Thalassospira mesophila]|uniref:Uncharacterized protein n=1 Tax=Thalassospira mesophila TaxID=1293891 RepID=A0A1Y2KVL6_9PROT|nr:hypothetical protein TMES_19945 [Thalassospira mesophila]
MRGAKGAGWHFCGGSVPLCARWSDVGPVSVCPRRVAAYGYADGKNVALRLRNFYWKNYNVFAVVVIFPVPAKCQADAGAAT